MGCIEVFVKLRTSAYQPVYFHPMKPKNASDTDRIQKLEARVAALEESNWGAARNPLTNKLERTALRKTSKYFRQMAVMVRYRTRQTIFERLRLTPASVGRLQ
jgi:hypothetical protein